MTSTTPSRAVSNQHIVITGAGSGIGRAIAQRLSADGYRLTLLGRRLSPLEETAQLCGAGANVRAASCDIRDAQMVRGAFADAKEWGGALFALVANAGIGGPNEPGELGEPGESATEDRFDDLVATNLNGTYHCLRAAQRHMAPGPEARHMLVIASILARIGVPGYTGYCASKAGLMGLSRAMAGELATDNVQVNAICPGWVDTSMAHEGLDGMAEGMGVSKDKAYEIAMQAVPLGRMSKPKDIAGMVAWLLSEDACGVTGQGLDMNGGAFMI